METDESSESQKKGPFCTGCGKQLLSTTEICPHCGTRAKGRPRGHRGYSYSELPKTPDGRTITGEKEMFVSILISFFFTGLGTVYAGDVRRGITLFVAIIVSVILAFVVVFFVPVLSLVFLVLSVVIWAYGIYDAYKVTEENNRIWYQFIDEMES